MKQKTYVYIECLLERNHIKTDIKNERKYI